MNTTPPPAGTGINPNDAARAQINTHVLQGWTIASDTGTIVALTKGKPVNHVLHLILSLVTFGFWILPWIIIALVGGVKTKTFNVPDGKGVQG